MCQGPGVMESLAGKPWMLGRLQGAFANTWVLSAYFVCFSTAAHPSERKKYSFQIDPGRFLYFNVSFLISPGIFL